MWFCLEDRQKIWYDYGKAAELRSRVKTQRNAGKAPEKESKRAAEKLPGSNCENAENIEKISLERFIEKLWQKK